MSLKILYFSVFLLTLCLNVRAANGWEWYVDGSFWLLDFPANTKVKIENVEINLPPSTQRLGANYIHTIKLPNMLMGVKHRVTLSVVVNGEEKCTVVHARASQCLGIHYNTLLKNGGTKCENYHSEHYDLGSSRSEKPLHSITQAVFIAENERSVQSGTIAPSGNGTDLIIHSPENTALRVYINHEQVTFDEPYLITPYFKFRRTDLNRGEKYSANVKIGYMDLNGRFNKMHEWNQTLLGGQRNVVNYDYATNTVASQVVNISDTGPILQEPTPSTAPVRLPVVEESRSPKK